VPGPPPVPHQAQPDFNDPNTFERVIFMKQNAAWLLEQELRKTDPSLEIALGTATDPYQPIERRALITRSILEVFARQRGFRLGIVTKSRLIERDLDLLQAIARQNTLVVHLTITTPDTALARKLEPRAPRPDLRFAAVRHLRDGGIRTGVLCSPLLPGITDSEEAIDGMARRSAAAGANVFAAQPLFLKPCSRRTYLSFVRENFPELVRDYEQRFGTAEFAAPSYRRQLALAVARACRRYGLQQRSSDALLTREPGRPQRSSQPRTAVADAMPPRKGPRSALAPSSQRSLFA
jgi:DNA repair photolyase